jgi:hypothetical protein
MAAECPDCAIPMHRIRLIDKAHFDRHRELEYALYEGGRSLWSGRFPVEGVVRAYICDQCARILLFGEPREES